MKADSVKWSNVVSQKIPSPIVASSTSEIQAEEDLSDLEDLELPELPEF